MFPKFLLLVVMALVALGPLANAQAPDFKACTAISSDTDRLKCYDDLAAPKKVETEIVSKWAVRTETSPMDDTRSVFVNLTSDDDFRGKFGQTRVNARLTIRCMENTTALMITMGDHFLADNGGFGDVEYRLDDEKPKTKGFEESTNHAALGLWDGGAAIPFIKNMLGRSKMVVRITPFSESPITTTFTIAGLDESIKPLREACKW